MTGESPVAAKKRKGSRPLVFQISRHKLIKELATEDSIPVPVKKSKIPKSAESKKESISELSAGTKGDSEAKDIKSATKRTNGSKYKPVAATDTKSELNLPQPIDEEEDVGQMADEEDEASDVDDQTEALLKGFESDRDEEDNENEGGLENGQAVPKIPTLNSKSAKALQRIKKSEISDKPGVIYVGRIPHGFYENEMREYFEQFGTILKLRLSRNPKNGASRHYAFIQFESAGVADIVTRTMDGYLMFNHILKVKAVPDEQVHDDLFKGANKRFKKVPWNKIRGRELQMGVSEGTWEKRIEKEKKRRDTKAEKAKKLLGYEFESPHIKSAKNVSKKPVEQLVSPIDDAVGIKAIEAPVIDPSKPKKKGKKAGKEEADLVKDVKAAPAISSISEDLAKAKTEKKSKKVKDTETPAASASTAEGSSKPKSGKEKEKNARSLETAPTLVNPTTNNPEKKLKPKKSKTALTEETTTAEDAAGPKNKSKKSKKSRSDA